MGVTVIRMLQMGRSVKTTMKMVIIISIGILDNLYIEIDIRYIEVQRT